MEKKVKYNLISSIFFILAGVVAIYPICIGTYKFGFYGSSWMTEGLLILFWGISYIVSGLLGIVNIEGKSRRLLKTSAIVMIVLSSLQVFIYFIAAIASRFFATALYMFLASLLISALGLLYAIGLLVDKKGFSIASFSIACFILFVGQIVVTIFMSRLGISFIGRFAINGGEWIFLIFILLLPALLFSAKAIANKNTINNF